MAHPRIVRWYTRRTRGVPDGAVGLTVATVFAAVGATVAVTLTVATVGYGTFRVLRWVAIACGALAVVVATVTLWRDHLRNRRSI